MKKTFLTTVALMLIAIPALACPPEDPNCHNEHGQGGIWAKQWQNQGHTVTPDPEISTVNSNAHQGGTQLAYGSGGNGFTGTAQMNQAEYTEYGETTEFDEGGSSKHYGFMYGESSLGGDVTPECDFVGVTHRHQGGNTYTEQTGNSMSASQGTSAVVCAHVSGAPETTTANLFQEQNHGYYQENGNSWQGGNTYTSTSTTVNIGDQPEP